MCASFDSVIKTVSFDFEGGSWVPFRDAALRSSSTRAPLPEVLVWTFSLLLPLTYFFPAQFGIKEMIIRLSISSSGVDFFPFINLIVFHNDNVTWIGPVCVHRRAHACSWSCINIVWSAHDFKPWDSVQIKGAEVSKAQTFFSPYLPSLLSRALPSVCGDLMRTFLSRFSITRTVASLSQL